MHVDILKEMCDKAKTKKDGVYSHKKNFYLVANGRLHSYSDYFGNISEHFGSFCVSKGKVRDRFEARDILKGYLKQLKYE